ncbi:hypothetical protein GCM10022267_90180 [Lentzea roselyniae]|uniref:Nudix hydrolase domain-containing protein n=1 Tax=Lentzea roselyniae TaxID=531940 RepID=A0ABP7CKB7_9PSEU
MDDGEEPADAARREVAEETGSFFQRWAASCGSGNHHRIDHVFLTRAADAAPKVTLKPTENEKAD